MQLISVNVGQERAIQNAKSSGVTGIYKQPTTAPIQINPLGLADDTICDTKNHGGVDQAVYVYGAPDYAWWSQRLGRDLAPGTFGENLTISELESATFTIGDRLRVGAVVLEVTGARIPCVTLAARMGDPQFVKRFARAERPGLYCRVITPGAVKASDPVSVEPFAGSPAITVLEGMRRFLHNDYDRETVIRFLAAPIDIRSRRFFEQMLAEMNQQT